MQERFVRLSRGGGEWAPLKRKRKRGRKVRAAILRDTSTLFKVFSPALGQLGQLQKDLINGVRVGFGGPAKHPKAKMTVAELAEIHHFGKGNVPVRKLLVDPSSMAVKTMTGFIEKHWERASK